MTCQRNQGNSGIFVRSKKCESHGMSTLRDGNRIYTEDREKAYLLNDHFKSVFKPDTCDITSVIHKDFTAGITDITIDEQDVYKVLKELNCAKATGPDGIPTRVLKDAASVLAGPLCHLYNISLRNGAIPQEWKLADVTPVFKKGQREDAKNYRPVSLTPIICKCLERLVCNQLLYFLKTNNILVEDQHGFRTGRSCETQLLECVNNWSEALDKKNKVDIIYLDISRAFDMVSHSKLLYKLRNIDINGNILSWLKSFLTGRKQRVRINNELSDWCDVTSGVPQGTIIGPVAFLIYINDISKNVKSNCKLYADDCVLYRCVNNSKDAEMLQHDHDRVVIWSSKWSMEFNVTKCKVMHLTKKRNVIFNSYFMNGTKLCTTNSEKYLGVRISNSLSWKPHIDVVRKECFQKLGIIKRVFSKCNKNIKVKLYKQLVRPKLDYCVNVWKPATPGLQKLIEKVQKRAAGLVLGHRVEDYTRDISVLSWSPIHIRQTCQELCLMYKIINNLIDIDFMKYFTFRQCSNNLRYTHSAQVTPKSARTNTCLQSYFYRIVPLWNSLPDNIVLSQILMFLKNY